MSFDFVTTMSPTKLWKTCSNGIKHYLGLSSQNVAVKESISTVAPKELKSLNNVLQLRFIRVAGLSGALAVALGAYGSHVLFPKSDVPTELKEVYKTANYYHFLHSLALLGVPLVKHPNLVGTLLTAGMTIFCGTCYFYALSGNKSVIVATPFGGTLLIIAWLSMLL